MKKMSAILGYIEKWGIFIALISILTILTVSIICRYVFQHPLSWPDELTTYLFILMTFFGASASVEDNSELKVEVLYEKFPKMRKAMDILLHGVRFTVSVVFIIIGIKYTAMELEMNTYTPILRLPVFLIFAMLPCWGCFMAFRSIERFCRLWTRS